MITTFETAQIGDRVYSPTFGWGEIICIDGFEHYPLGVRFKNTAIDTYYFTLEGYYYEDVPIQSLFWDEVVIEAPIKPVKLAAVKIVNGVEIPNISFNPNPGEYCYSPVPTHPDLYRPLYYCHNETNEYLKNNGLCYPYTEKGKTAAILHAKAMLKTN
jgi:hypothetical protein